MAIGSVADALVELAPEQTAEMVDLAQERVVVEPGGLADSIVAASATHELDDHEVHRREGCAVTERVLEIGELGQGEPHLELHGDAGATVHLGDEIDTERAQVHLLDLDVHADEPGDVDGALRVLLSAPSVIEERIIADTVERDGAACGTRLIQDAAEDAGGLVVHVPIIGPAPLIVNTEKKLIAHGDFVDLSVGIGLPVVRCTHALLRELGGGVCPVCADATPDVPELEDLGNGLASSDVVRSEHEEGPYAQVTNARAQGHSAPAQHGEDASEPWSSSGPLEVGLSLYRQGSGSNPPPPPTARPPIVEHPTPLIAPIGAAHELDIQKADIAPAPAYMYKPLRTLTRAEATDLLLKLRARRMTMRLSRFIRGPSGTGRDGAWAELEGGDLDWNWHHDALCDHVQVMLEEWELAGVRDPSDPKLMSSPVIEAEIERKLELWLKWSEDDERRAYVQGMIDHWNKPLDEGGCGRGRYKQRITDGAFNVGPISLKSRIVMVFAIAWMWLRVPGWEVFCSSGTPSNVDRDSLATRDLVTSEWYRETFQIPWSIRLDLDRVSKWGTTAGGTREARGAGSKVTGIHADALLLDDPDDASGVWSEASRRDILLFWRALGNRLKDPTRPLRLIVQQNLHEEDLSTRCVADGMPRLAIPVEFNTDRRPKLYTMPFGWMDPRLRDGELLQPSRFTIEYIAAERIRLGTHGFEAQYNCNPVPIGGGLFARSWFQFFRIEDAEEHERADVSRPRPTGCRGSGGEYGTREAHPAYTLTKRKGQRFKNELSWMLGQLVAVLDLDWLTISVDATFGSKKATSSAVALIVVGGKGQRRFVFDVVARPMTFLETVAALRVLIAKWPAKKVLIELKANGAALIEELTLLMAESKVLGVDGTPVSVAVEAINPDGGKESRAAAMMPAVEAGMVYLFEGAAWLEAFLGEVCVFPNSKRDDQVDALSQLMTFYREPDVVSKWRKLAGKK